MLLAERKGIVPCSNRAAEHVVGVGNGHAAFGEHRMINRNRRDAHCFVLTTIAGNTLRSATMIADHAEHVLLVLLVTIKRSVLSSKHSTGCIGTTGQDGTERAAHCTTSVTVVGDTSLHQHGAKVGVAETKGAVLPTEFSNFLGWEAGHQHADFQDHGPQTDGVLVTLDVEGARL